VDRQEGEGARAAHRPSRSSSTSANVDNTAEECTSLRNPTDVKEHSLDATPHNTRASKSTELIDLSSELASGVHIAGL